MSYCVNCGVELAPSEKRCPLCDTPVINPKSPWTEPDTRPFPKRVERVLSKSDRRFGVSLASVLLVVPVATTMLGNYFSQQTISWSLYVAGGCLCLFVFGLLPLLHSKSNPYLFWLYDAVAVQLYLADIAYLSGGLDWYLPLAMPLGLAASLFALMLIAVIRAKNMLALRKAALVMVSLGLLVVSIELVINLHLAIVPTLRWSLFALAPCLVLAALFLIVEKNAKFKDEVRRRFFY